MSEMIERVTKAVRNAREMSLCSLCDGRYRRMLRCSCEEIARAAIEAMRDPSPEIIKAWLTYYSAFGADETDAWSGQADGVWRAMIDSALANSHSSVAGFDRSDKPAERVLAGLGGQAADEASPSSAATNPQEQKP